MQPCAATAGQDEELKDPSSPLYRSLSQVPPGLPKIRTRSEDGELLMDTADADDLPGPARHAQPRKSSFLAPTPHVVLILSQP